MIYVIIKNELRTATFLPSADNVEDCTKQLALLLEKSHYSRRQNLWHKRNPGITV